MGSLMKQLTTTKGDNYAQLLLQALWVSVFLGVQPNAVQLLYKSITTPSAIRRGREAELLLHALRKQIFHNCEFDAV